MSPGAQQSHYATGKSEGCTVPETQFHGVGGREASHGSGHGSSNMQAVSVKVAQVGD